MSILWMAYGGREGIFRILKERYDTEELRTLCFRLGISYDDLRGEGRVGKIRELILLTERKGKESILASTLASDFLREAGY